MILRELEAITKSGKVNNGVLNPNDLGENERLLLGKYLTYKVSKCIDCRGSTTYLEYRVLDLTHFRYLVNMARNLSLVIS
jgi:hypothetical protein